MKGKLSKVPRAEQWAGRISSQMGKSVGSIIDVGRLLVKAKDDLAHGEWMRLFEANLVPFGIRSAQMLMMVASHPTIGNTKHASHLPPSWDSLYRLTRIDPERLRAAFKDGLITPDMQRREVKALMPAPKSARKTNATREDPSEAIGVGYRTAGGRLYFKIARLLSDDFDSLSIEDQDTVLNMLEQTLNELRANRFPKVAEA